MVSERGVQLSLKCAGCTIEGAGRAQTELDRVFSFLQEFCRGMTGSCPNPDMSEYWKCLDRHGGALAILDPVSAARWTYASLAAQAQRAAAHLTRPTRSLVFLF